MKTMSKTETRVPISECTSIAIRKMAEAQGLDDIVLVGRYEHPEHPRNSDCDVILWRADEDWYALETNGDPVWEHQQPTFDDTLNEYGIEL